MRTGSAERREHLLQLPGHLGGVEPGGPEYIVHPPGDDGGQVRAQRQGRSQLLLAYLARETPSYGQIGVLHPPGVHQSEALGEPIGEATQAGCVVPPVPPSPSV